MNIKTKEVILTHINQMIEKENHLEKINWIMENDDKITCVEDLILGYCMGSLYSVMKSTILDLKKLSIFETYFKLKMEEIYGKEEGIKKYCECKLATEKTKNPIIKRSKIKLNENEVITIRNILGPIIVRYREKIHQQLVVSADEL